ncbi:MAG: hypothetical protein ACOCRB_02595 [Halanaerobiaceae bacterium]
MVYETKTKLDCDKVKEKVKQYFGAGLGLELKEKSENCLNFEGSGGFVNITCCSDDEDTNTVELQTREWDRKVKTFMKKI